MKQLGQAKQPGEHGLCTPTQNRHDQHPWAFGGTSVVTPAGK